MSIAVPYPIFLNLHGRHVLIVGGGVVALRKANGLIRTGAKITVVSPQIAAEFEHLTTVTLRREPYSSAILPGSPRFALVFAATNQPAVNAAVAADAASHGILCTQADVSENADFANGAVHHQAGVSLAVSTHGSSPMLAARIRDDLVKSLDVILPQWSILFCAWRAKVHADVTDSDARRALLIRLAGPDMEWSLRVGGPDSANQTADAWIKAAKSEELESP
jgi:precorrin-2 dehydrogenase/sirohydrochlorin ferrochelatase